MKLTNVKAVAALTAFLTLQNLFAADVVSSALNMGFRDMAVVKQKAEQGDASAQVILADSLAGSFHATEALGWYRKAAAQGNVEGMYHLGQMLLFGAPGIPANLSVTPAPTEGIRWTFMAATNHHAQACWNMGKALRQGLGTSQDPISAYAWLKLFSETIPGSITGKVEMNELALKMDTGSLQQAQQLAARFKAGDWKAPTIRSLADGDPRLKLNGITYGGKTPLAVINGKTLSEGESAKITVKPTVLTIKCMKIETNSVIVAIDGEDAPRRLSLK